MVVGWALATVVKVTSATNASARRVMGESPRVGRFIVHDTAARMPDEIGFGNSAPPCYIQWLIVGDRGWLYSPRRVELKAGVRLECPFRSCLFLSVTLQELPTLVAGTERIQFRQQQLSLWSLSLRFRIQRLPRLALSTSVLFRRDRPTLAHLG